MDYQLLVKKFVLPVGFNPPKELRFEGLIAKPLGRTDLKADLNAVNSSIDIIQKTRGGSWPTEELKEDFDFLDLAWHELEFRDNRSFAYAVYGKSNVYIGCFYLFPIGERTALSDATIEYDVDASWWVTTQAYSNGYYPKLYMGLQEWLTKNFPFKKIYYSNKEIPV